MCSALLHVTILPYLGWWRIFDSWGRFNDDECLNIFFTSKVRFHLIYYVWRYKEVFYTEQYIFYVAIGLKKNHSWILLVQLSDRRKSLLQAIVEEQMFLHVNSTFWNIEYVKSHGYHPWWSTDLRNGPSKFKRYIIGDFSIEIGM